MLYREKALQIALSQVGVTESPAGSNSGTKVREYQAATSLGGTGWPWCAAFVNWCFLKAGKPLNELGRSASVAIVAANARARGWTVSTPRPGDIVCYDWDGGAPDHIGIVKQVQSSTQFVAVEGNTSLSNQSNGGEVMERIRWTSQVECFIRVPGGVKILDRFRVSKGGKTVRMYAKKVRAVHKVVRIAKHLKKGVGVGLKHVQVRRKF